MPSFDQPEAGAFLLEPKCLRSHCKIIKAVSRHEIIEARWSDGTKLALQFPHLLMDGLTRHDDDGSFRVGRRAPPRPDRSIRTARRRRGRVRQDGDSPRATNRRFAMS